MHTVWVGKTTDRNLKSLLRSVVHCLLVDVIPVILLLAAMAYGMAFVSGKLVEPHSVELRAVVKKLS